MLTPEQSKKKTIRFYPLCFGTQTPTKISSFTSKQRESLERGEICQQTMGVAALKHRASTLESTAGRIRKGRSDEDHIGGKHIRYRSVKKKTWGEAAEKSEKEWNRDIGVWQPVTCNSTACNPTKSRNYYYATSGKPRKAERWKTGQKETELCERVDLKPRKKQSKCWGTEPNQRQRRFQPSLCCGGIHRKAIEPKEKRTDPNSYTSGVVRHIGSSTGMGSILR